MSNRGQRMRSVFVSTSSTFNLKDKYQSKDWDKDEDDKDNDEDVLRKSNRGAQLQGQR